MEKRKRRCKYCGEPIVQDTSGRGWRHGETGSYECYHKYATPGRTDKAIISKACVERLPRFPYHTWDRKDDGNHQELVGLQDVLQLFKPV